MFDINVLRQAVNRVYSGRPGCMCGCRGSYSSARGQVTRVLNIMAANADRVVVDDNMLTLDLDNRSYTAYLGFPNDPDCAQDANLNRASVRDVLVRAGLRFTTGSDPLTLPCVASVLSGRA